MQGKVCLVTGGTAGIGYVTARALAKRGATVTIVGRHLARGTHAADAIRRDVGHERVEFLPADLSSRAEVRVLAAKFLERHDKLDVLVNNAGAMFALRRESADGVEMTLALNHLGPFLLTHLLLDRLKASAPARIVNVASAAHWDVRGFDFDDPQLRRRGLGAYPRTGIGNAFYTFALPWAHPGLKQYARSKLANILFTTELARRLEGTGVTANALHPGVVASSFGDGNGIYGWFTRRYLAMGGIGVEEGAQTSIHLAMSDDVAGVSGKYFAKQRIARCSDAARDAQAAKRLWHWSEDMLGL
jgi:NAD(P)-dependent dehydrogenase (short-subunit alcohol dehydrogenase family)